METKYCLINSYGDTVENIEDAVCIQTKAECDYNDRHESFEVIYDTRMKQLVIGYDRYQKLEEETQLGQKIRLPLEMICLGSDDPEEIKTFALTIRKFADCLEKMIS